MGNFQKHPQRIKYLQVCRIFPRIHFLEVHCTAPEDQSPDLVICVLYCTKLYYIYKE